MFRGGLRPPIVATLSNWQSETASKPQDFAGDLMLALIADFGFERLEELISGCERLVWAEAVRRRDHAVAFERRDDA